MKEKLNLLKRLLRVKQWIKNLFIFAPIVFAQKLLNGRSFIKVVLATILFCVLSSCIYILNDIIDIESDKQHPKKKQRPIASGEISKKKALVIVSILFPMSIISGLYLDMGFGIVMILYFLNSYLYSKYIKNKVILDVISIAIGFVLRVIAGAEVINVYISQWILICTLFLALFLGLCKRRNEIAILGDDAEKVRKNLGEYSISLIDNMVSIVISMTLTSYTVYTFFSQNDTYLMLATVPIVIYGVFRYQYLVHDNNEGESPEETILKDKPLRLSVLLWGLVIVVATYY